MVHIEQLYTKCVAEAAYIIISKGEAVVIDPLRETKPYLEKLAAWTGEEGKEEIIEGGAKLKYIFETHFHADFVSGHRQLSKATGAPIVFGPQGKPNFEAEVATDNQVFQVGDVTLTVLHTPGHTMESSCYLLKDETGKNKALFTGDTLFIGDVGRPDLAQKAADLTMEQLAGTLYDSLRTRVMVLEDDLIIYPGHGAGAATSGPSERPSSLRADTLGAQKRLNYGLGANVSREEFIDEVTAELPRAGSKIVDSTSSDPVSAKALTLTEFVAAMEDKTNESHIFPTKEAAEKLDLDFSTAKSVLILDTRTMAEFPAAHIPGSIFAGLQAGPVVSGMWTASCLGNLSRPYLLIAGSPLEATEAVSQLHHSGIRNHLGYLQGGGLTCWVAAGKPVASIPSISPSDLFVEYEDDTLRFYKNEERKEGGTSATATPTTGEQTSVFNRKNNNLRDCRTSQEIYWRHLPGIEQIPFNMSNVGDIDFTACAQPATFICKAAYRSLTFCSLLLHACPEAKLRQIGGVRDVAGGYNALAQHPELAREMVVQGSMKMRMDSF